MRDFAAKVFKLSALTLCFIILAATLLALPAVSPAPSAYAATIVDSGTCGANGDNLTWTLDSEGTLTISGMGDMKEYNSGNVPWSKYSQSIKTVNIGNKVTNIGNCAFYDCSALTSITIPSSVTSIGNSAFSSCSSLTGVTLPDSVTSIGTGAFEDCSKLTDVTLPNSVTSIGFSAFEGCRSLVAITIPNNIRGIGYAAFSGCSKLTSVTIGNSVTEIDASAFYNCSALTNISFPDGVISIGDSAFSGCSKLTGVTLPNSVTDIGGWAFSGCSSLTGIRIPNSVTSIGSYAFSGCSSLADVIISDSVAYIGYGAFLGCSSLTDVTIPNGVIGIGDAAFSGCSLLADVTIPDSVIGIGASAFYGCSKLASVTIPNSVTKIGSSAFFGCSSLASVTLSDSITSIGSSAFSGCSSLTNITIPDTITSIADHTFYGCSSLTDITIPDSVTVVYSSAFDGCTNLADVYYCGSETQWRKISIANFNTPLLNATIHYNYAPVVDSGTCGDNLTWTLDKNGTLTISGTGDMYHYDPENGTFAPWNDNRKLIKMVAIDSTVTRIGRGAFCGCSSLTDINIPSAIQAIYDYTFYGCLKLAEIELPAGITAIGQCAFEFCSSLEKIVIPDGTSTIYEMAFQQCTSLSDITIPDSVTEIGSSAFCDTAYYNDENNWQNDVLYIDSALIEAKDSLSSAYEIKSGTTVIANSALCSCSALTEITIPGTVTNIGIFSFAYCRALQTVYYDGTKEAWDKIKIQSVNTCLTNSIIHYHLGMELSDWKYDSESHWKYCKCADDSKRYESGTHNMGDWSVTCDPTYKTSGTEERSCSVCKYNESREIPPLVFPPSVTRIAGNSRTQTAVEISKKGFDSADTVILADGMGYADSLAGVPLAYALDAPILLVCNSQLDSVTTDEITRLGAKNIIILGGVAVVGNDVAADLQAMGCTVERIFGNSRFETAIQIAKKLETVRRTKPDEVFFACAYNYADALSVGGVAAIKGAPILYIASDGVLADCTEAYLKDCGAETATILGGNAAVSSDAEINIGATGVANVPRVFGNSRFATCVAINKSFADVFTGNSLCVATGMNFPDALAGGVFAAKNGAPLVLVPQTLTDTETDYIDAQNPTYIYIFGGQSAVSADIENQLKNYLAS